MSYRATEDTAAGKPSRLRQNRDFRLWWGGTMLSAIGDEVTAVALPLIVLMLTSSPLQAGLVGSVEAIPPLLLSLPIGMLVDRVSRRVLMVGASLLSMASIVTVPFAYLADGLSLPQLYVVAFVNSLASTTYRIANTAALPGITGRHKLGEAASQSETIWGTSALLAPPLAGLMFESMSPAAPFFLDALSFVAITLAILAIRSRLGPDGTPPPLHWRRELTAGMRITARLPLVRTLTVLTAVGDFLFAGIGLLLIVLAKDSGASGFQVGTVFTAAGVGSLLGAALAPRVESRLGLRTAVVGKHWLTAALFPLLLLGLPPWGIGAVWGLVAGQVAVLNVIQMKYLMSQVRDDQLGRVEGFMTFLSQSSLPLGYALTGALLDRFGSRHTLLVFEGVLLVLACYALVGRGLREGDAPPAGSGAAPPDASADRPLLTRPGSDR
ncbi:MFS transporter [Streptomyces cinnamoneus]|uniref:MFS transporter n=1 Tax=Streptomyces cinnamoneus TaxID=53446 RepID=A0A918TGB4_STRCJ|nr:MFS transporter [Streptomyces cinnamoneus]GHC43886.1 MFS transporter [Streptomyces cinnamoneus]